jgi:kelch-like protein 17 (actinfilin)/kelch-like protein 20
MPITAPTTSSGVSIDMTGNGNGSVKHSGSACGAVQWGLLALVVVACAFGLGGVIVGALLTERVNDLEASVSSLKRTVESTATVRVSDLDSTVRVSDLEASVSSLKRTAEITDGLVMTQSAESPAGYSFGGSLHAGAGEWAPAVHLPGERSDLQAVACAGVIVLLGGLNASSAVQDSVWSFDPVQEVWATDLPPMPTGRFRFSAACLAGKVYVAGGYHSYADGEDGLCVATVDRYDVAARSWDSVAPLSIARGDLALAASGGKLYAFGGYGYKYPYPDPAADATEVYDPLTGVWAAAAKMPNGGKGDISAVEMGGEIYVPGGWMNAFSDQLVAYNPSSDSWATLAPMHAARGDKAVVGLDGRLYVVGGETWSGRTAPCRWDTAISCDVNQVPIHGVEQFTPTTGTWVPVSPLPDARFRFAAAAANGAIFVFGGHAHNEVAVNTAWSFHLVNHPNAFFHVRQATA